MNAFQLMMGLETLALRMERHLANALDIDGNFRDLVGDEPDFDPIRSDPDFKALVQVIV